MKQGLNAIFSSILKERGISKLKKGNFRMVALFNV